MSFEPKEGTTNVFKNQKTKDTQPDWTGTILIDGKKRKIAMWEKQGAKGPYFSVNIQADNYKPKEQGSYDQSPVSKPSGNPVRNPVMDEMEDEIPFSPLRGAMIASY